MTSRNLRVKLTPCRHRSLTLGHKSRTPFRYYLTSLYPRPLKRQWLLPAETSLTSTSYVSCKRDTLPSPIYPLRHKSSHQPKPLSTFECDVIYGRLLYRTVSELSQFIVRILDTVVWATLWVRCNVLCSSWAHSKAPRVLDFLLVLIELFAMCHGWGIMSENRLKSGVLQGSSQYPPNFRLEETSPPIIIYKDR